MSNAAPSVPLDLAPYAYTPAADRDRPGAPVYRLKPPTAGERHAFRAALIGRLGSNPSEAELLDLCRDGVAASTDFDAAEKALFGELVEHVAERNAALMAWVVRSAAVGQDDGPAPEPLSAADLDRWSQLESHLRMVYPPLAAAFARRALWSMESPRAAFARFVVGWTGVVDVEGRPLPCRRPFGEIAEATIEQLDAAQPGHVQDVGGEILRVMTAGAAFRKKSAPPSGSREIPAPSPEIPPTGGATSTADAGGSASAPAPTSTS